MNIILFVCPGIMGPCVFYFLSQRKDVHISYIVLPLKAHAVSNNELLSLAQQTETPCLAPLNLSDPGFISEIKEAKPDLIIVASYDTKIPAEVLTIPTVAAVNIHPSLLPKYRGACPEFWAIRNGEKRTGVTLHSLTERFDDGDILLQEYVAISPIDTLGTLLYKVSEVSVYIINRYIDKLILGERIVGIKQIEGVATQAPLVDQNALMIVWADTCKNIVNLIRASNPLGGAWTTSRGFQLKIWYAIYYGEDPVSLPAISDYAPGQIYLHADTNKVFIRGGDGFIELTTVQYALNFIIDAWHFAVYTGLKTGDCLGG